MFVRVPARPPSPFCARAKRRGPRRALGLSLLVAVGAALAPGSAAAAAPPAWDHQLIQALPGTTRTPSSVRAAGAYDLPLPPSPSSPPQSQAAPPKPEVLSNERTFTRWAHPASRSYVFATPDAGSRHVSRLRLYTEDGFDEVYVLLRTAYDSRGREWVQLRLPQRPNGRTGWVPRSQLGRFRLNHFQLVVDRRTLRATLFVNGRRRWHAPVGVGKRSTPTPGGHFWIREGFRVHGVPTYGPYAFGTADYSVLTDWPGGGVVGIHGTDEPKLVPGRPSHGCMRMHNRDVSWLAHHMPVGTPLLIR